MTRAPHLSLFDPPTLSFLVPTKAAPAVARWRGQGRPYGRRAERAFLDGGEHGRTLADLGTSVRRQPLGRRIVVPSVLAVLLSMAAVPLSRGSALASEPRAIASIVDEAAARFDLPASWIHAVIRAESRGEPRAVSPKGAMGLMQLMPATWRALTAQHGLGHDPFDRRANVLAGAAYLRQLFDQFGREGFLAAYNAGPRRYAEARGDRRRLPVETVNYVAEVERTIATASPGVSVPAARDWRGADLFAEPGLGADGEAGRALFVQGASR